MDPTVVNEATALINAKATIMAGCAVGAGLALNEGENNMKSWASLEYKATQIHHVVLRSLHHFSGSGEEIPVPTSHVHGVARGRGG